MRHFSYFFVTAAAFVLTLSEQDLEEFCKDKKHYNDVGFTCCANKNYDSPQLYSSSRDDEAMSSCLKTDEVTQKTTLIARSWLLYKCLVKSKITGELNMDTFADFMVKRYPPEIQKSIKSTANEVMKLIMDQKKARRKRSLRVKREEEEAAASDDSTSTTSPEKTEEDKAAASVDSTSTTSPEKTEEDKAAASDDSTSTTSPEKTEEDKAAPEAGGEQAAQNDEATNSTPLENDSDTTTEAEVPTSTDNIETTTDPNPTPENAEEPPPKNEESDTDKTTLSSNTDAPTGTPATPKPFYRYLASFDYYDQFKDKIPDEDLFIIWDAYYVAEFQTCQSKGGSDENYLMSYLTKRCLTWTQQTIRAGDCCDAAPVPLPLIQDTTIPKETIQNFTAEQIMSLTGTYTWTNLTFSSNIYRCNRLAKSVLQKKVSIEDIQNEIEAFINGTTITEPNYEEIAKKLLPPYYTTEIEEKLIEEILPPTTPPSKAGEKPEKTSYFDSILYDSDIQTISNFEYPVYQWAVASEWDSLDENQTRYLMWMCDAYRMVSQRIKFFDETPRLMMGHLSTKEISSKKSGEDDSTLVVTA